MAGVSTWRASFRAGLVHMVRKRKCQANVDYRQKMSSRSERSAKKTARRAYSWMLRVFHANGTYDSRVSRCDTRSAGGDRHRLPDHRNVADPSALPAPWTLRASQREADAHPSNRRRHTDSSLRIGHGRVLPELDAGAAAGGAVLSRGKLRPCRTRLERSGARAAHGSADRAGATRAAEFYRSARAICSRWALVRRICEPGVRASVSR